MFRGKQNIDECLSFNEHIIDLLLVLQAVLQDLEWPSLEDLERQWTIKVNMLFKILHYGLYIC